MERWTYDRVANPKTLIARLPVLRTDAEAADLVLAVDALRVRNNFDRLLDAVRGNGRPPSSETVRLGQTGRALPAVYKDRKESR